METHIDKKRHPSIREDSQTNTQRIRHVEPNIEVANLVNKIFYLQKRVVDMLI